MIKYLRILFVLGVFSRSIVSCNQTVNSSDQQLEESNISQESEDDYFDMVDFSLEEYGLNILLKLPEVSDAKTEAITKVSNLDSVWHIELGSHFHFIIEDKGHKENLVLVEKNRTLLKDSLFNIEFQKDEPNLIMYSLTPKAVEEEKGMHHFYGKKELNGRNYVFKSFVDGSFEPIIVDMVRTFRSAKTLE